jgi:hypothetical protein
MVLIAHKNARFLSSYFDSYRYEYKPQEWYYNAGRLPAKILLNHSYLAHRVDRLLGTHTKWFHNLYRLQNWKELKEFYTIHLLINHRSYLDKNSHIKEFNETNIWTYNRTYGVIARNILRRANLFLPKYDLFKNFDKL